MAKCKQCNKKKYPCPDCHFCQFCAEIRCIACRRQKSKPKLTSEEQIQRFEELNHGRTHSDQPIYYSET
jgi:hypothetical protein